MWLWVILLYLSVFLIVPPSSVFIIPMQTFSPRYPCFNQHFHILWSLSYTLVQLTIFFLVIASIIFSQLGSSQSDKKYSHILWKDLILTTFSLSFCPFLALGKTCEEIDILKGAHILLLHVSIYHVIGLSSCNYFIFFPTLLMNFLWSHIFKSILQSLLQVIFCILNDAIQHMQKCSLQVTKSYNRFYRVWQQFKDT